MKNDKYYGLRFISLVCKAITTLIALIGIGMLGAHTITILTISPRPDTLDLFQLWTNDAFLILLVSGFFAFIFFIISQIIDVQMSINMKLNNINDILKSLSNVTASLEKVENAPKPSESNEEIKEMLRRQSRLISRVYKDTVGESDESEVKLIQKP